MIIQEKSIKDIYKTEFKPAYEKENLEKMYDLMCENKELINLFNADEVVLSLKAVEVGSSTKLHKNIIDYVRRLN